MMTSNSSKQPALAKWGWIILLAVSALLVLHGVSWFFVGPDRALTNIAERTSLASDGFQQGSPSAFDVITLLSRNSSVYEVAFGLFALSVAWRGYRHGSRWVWKLTWVLVFAFIALAVVFVLAGG
ncbi:MAG: hypothetical protein R3300_20915, partial [Candidatus Promineifilaceae bacterium]|nr:hypothetical protein [Candidatus Promineifilaceae bacterium]